MSTINTTSSLFPGIDDSSSYSGGPSASTTLDSDQVPAEYSLKPKESSNLNFTNTFAPTHTGEPTPTAAPSASAEPVAKADDTTQPTNTDSGEQPVATTAPTADDTTQPNNTDSDEQPVAATAATADDTTQPTNTESGEQPVAATAATADDTTQPTNTESGEQPVATTAPTADDTTQPNNTDSDEQPVAATAPTADDTTQPNNTDSDEQPVAATAATADDTTQPTNTESGEQPVAATAATADDTQPINAEATEHPVAATTAATADDTAQPIATDSTEKPFVAAKSNPFAAAITPSEASPEASPTASSDTQQYQRTDIDSEYRDTVNRWLSETGDSSGQYSKQSGEGDYARSAGSKRASYKDNPADWALYLQVKNYKDNPTDWARKLDPNDTEWQNNEAYIKGMYGGAGNEDLKGIGRWGHSSSGWGAHQLGSLSCTEKNMFGLYTPGRNTVFAEHAKPIMDRSNSMVDFFEKMHNQVSARTNSGNVRPQASLVKELEDGTALRDSDYNPKVGDKNGDDRRFVFFGFTGDGDRGFSNSVDNIAAGMKRFGAETYNLGTASYAKVREFASRLAEDFRNNPDRVNVVALQYEGHGNYNGGRGGSGGDRWYGQNGWTAEGIHSIVELFKGTGAVFNINSSCHSGAIHNGPGRGGGGGHDYGDPRNGPGNRHYS